jgi:ubiquinone/menaquinone biosynthesis C-methylase UbiE
LKEPIMHTDTVIEAFTELAPGYEESMQQELKQYWGVNYRDFIHDFVSLANIKAGERVLDIATGTARIPRGILESPIQPGLLIGLDITYAMLAEGKAQLENEGSTGSIRLVCGSALNLPFCCGSLDVIVCGLGTHHIQVPQLIAEMRRVLKPGGRLLLADVSASRFWRSIIGNLLIRFLAQRYRTSNHNARAEAELEAFPNVRTPEEWRDILLTHQFSQIHLKEIKPRLPWYPGGFHAIALAG